MKLLTKKTMRYLYRYKNGFTLIELMVVVAIIGILAAIAYPGYEEAQRKTRRADAEGALLSFANALERYYTQNNNSYCDIGTVNGSVAVAANTCSGAANDTGITPGSVYAPPNNTRTFYEISITAVTANTYTLQADPIGIQTNDRCGNLTLMSTGAKGQDAPGTAAECWKN